MTCKFECSDPKCQVKKFFDFNTKRGRQRLGSKEKQPPESENIKRCLYGFDKNNHSKGKGKRYSTNQCRAVRAAYEALKRNHKGRRLIDSRRGVVLADEVGIGKTFEALATAALLWRDKTGGDIKKRYRILLLVPSMELQKKWHIKNSNDNRDESEDIAQGTKFEIFFDRITLDAPRSDFGNQRGLQIVSLTHRKLGKIISVPKKNKNRKRKPLGDNSFRDLDLIIVDEAHHLRGGRKLAKSLETLLNVQKRPKDVRLIFLTATPFQVEHISELTRLLSFLDYAHLPNRVPYLKNRKSEGNTRDDCFSVDKESEWLKTNKFFKKKRTDHLKKYGFKSAVEAICFGLARLKQEAEKSLDCQNCDKRLRTYYHFLDKDIDKNKKTRGRTTDGQKPHANPYREKQSTVQKWRLELMPAVTPSCARMAKLEDKYFKLDEDYEEGLDNYLREFIIRNRKKSLNNILPEKCFFVGSCEDRNDETTGQTAVNQETFTNQDFVKRYLDNRRELVGEPKGKKKASGENDDLSFREVLGSATKTGGYHSKYLRLASTLTVKNRDAAQTEDRSSTPSWDAPKMMLLLDILKKRNVIPENAKCARKKAVIFFESVAGSLQLVKKRLKEILKSKTKLGCKLKDLAQLSGDTPSKKTRDKRRTRSEVIRDFNVKNKHPYILLCSKVSSEGIDLHKACNIVIHYDMHWNPTVLDQRTGRVYRDLKTAREVSVYKLALSHSYDKCIENAEMQRRRYKDFLLGESTLNKFLEADMKEVCLVTESCKSCR